VEQGTLCPATGGATTSDASARPGTQLHIADSVTLWGVTGDGYAIYTDDTALMVYATPLDGGAAVPILAITPAESSSAWVSVQGNVALVWTGAPWGSETPGVEMSPLVIWSASGGAQALATASWASATVVSADSRRILYLDHCGGSGTCDVYEANVDGTGVTSLAKSIADYPNFYFVGRDVAVQSLGLSIYSPPAWRPQVDLAVNQLFDSVGTELLVETESDVLQVDDLTSARSTVIDPGGAAQARLSSGGRDVLYLQPPAGSPGEGCGPARLMRSSVSSPSPVTLATFDQFNPACYGAGAPLMLSPDQRTVLLSSNLIPYSYYVASAVDPGSFTQLTSACGCAYGVPQFTGDSSHIIFNSCKNYNTGAGPATLSAASVDGGDVVILGQNPFSAFTSGASRVVFGDDYAQLGTGPATIDIESVDVAAGTPSIRAVSQADPSFFLSPSGDRIVYTRSTGPEGSRGLFVTRVP
jgi:hypothetical protein